MHQCDTMPGPKIVRFTLGRAAGGGPASRPDPGTDRLGCLCVLGGLAPFGFGGVISAAGLVFFAVFGYDTLTTAAEEAKDPQRDLPRAVLLSLLVAMILYVAMSLVLTGMVPYPTLNNPAPVANAFLDHGLNAVSTFISLAAIAGITSVLIAFSLGAARVWFAISRDGLLPSDVDHRPDHRGRRRVHPD